MKIQILKERCKNVITHCLYCKSTILWDRFGRACLLKSGNNQVFDCLETGCALIVERVPENCSSPGDVGSLLIALIHGGIPADVAKSAALKLVHQNFAA